ncbi:hypothetical protein SAMN05444362_11762 [Dysgonomonas macrotermitis]|uniref:Uncharacterized protein n=1 Tax=Dysgonomonas macrotermitis TaxID=1346286 RepID=A0A1M5HWA3_9BACT|nr:hypothetical protein SAMN05444362_11762 [Dysgonomonas macrotermitis]
MEINLSFYLHSYFLNFPFTINNQKVAFLDLEFLRTNITYIPANNIKAQTSVVVKFI